jgi:hypothetical protein
MRYTQVNREWSSTIVRKKREPFIEFIENGPQISQRMISKRDSIQVW